jgi:Rrf2 family protein
MDIALHDSEGPVLLKDIAKRQGISQQYLAHLITPLKITGIVKAVRGAQGGFTIARSPSQITLDEAVQALEGEIALVKCVDNPKAYPYSSTCAAHDLWQELTMAMIKTLKDRTLQGLIDSQKLKAKTDSLD